MQKAIALLALPKELLIRKEPKTQAFGASSSQDEPHLGSFRIRIRNVREPIIA